MNPALDELIDVFAEVLVKQYLQEIAADKQESESTSNEQPETEVRGL